jgi:putative transposase
VRVSGKGSGRISIAGLVCFQPGRRACPPRLIYRTREHRRRKGERRSLSERDYADLLDAAHQQLGGPIMLVWDNLNTHISYAMRDYIAARHWLTVYRIPAYAPELNAAEGVWANLTPAWATTTSTAWTPSKPRSKPNSKACSTDPTYSPASSPTPA